MSGGRRGGSTSSRDHVLEHLRRPVEDLRRAAGLLKARGKNGACYPLL